MAGSKHPPRPFPGTGFGAKTSAAHPPRPFEENKSAVKTSNPFMTNPSDTMGQNVPGASKIYPGKTNDGGNPGW